MYGLKLAGVDMNRKMLAELAVSDKDAFAALADKAKAAVKGICEDPEPGTIYQGTVKRIMDFGAFIEILPGKEGLCHISKLSRARVEKVTDVLKEGQVVPVKLLEVDKMGRLNLSYIDAVESK